MHSVTNKQTDRETDRQTDVITPTADHSLRDSIQSAKNMKVSATAYISTKILFNLFYTRTI